MTEANDVTSCDGPKCPYCGAVHSDAEDWIDVVSFWGSESGPVEFVCQSCDLVFQVSEVVMRHWDSTPIVQPQAK